MQLVVVMAVRKAVSAATTTFTAISMIRFFIIQFLSFSTLRRKDTEIIKTLRLRVFAYK